MKYRKLTLITVCIAIGLVVAISSIKIMRSKPIINIEKDQKNVGKDEHETNDGHADEETEHNNKKTIKITNKQAERFNIKTLVLTKSHFQHRVTFPGQIALNENKITHVVASVPGTVKEIFKGLGEAVKAGEALAVLQSREMAEAKSAYISAYKNLSLNKSLFEKDEKLWKINAKSEVQFIQARNQYENTKIDLERARQKLLALSMSEEQIKNLPEETIPLNTYSIDAPIDGKIIERHITLGEVVSSDKQVFVIANLDTVWVNLAVPAEDLPEIKNAQKVDIFTHQGEDIISGVIMYVSPVINEESRTGRAIIQLNNPNYELHPGDFVKAQVIISEQSAFLNVPNNAVQRIDGQLVVFVKQTEDIFEAVPIQIKGSDKNEFIEVIDGLNEGDEIVITNTFFLKAELGKSTADHSH